MLMIMWCGSLPTGHFKISPSHTCINFGHNAEYGPSKAILLYHSVPGRRLNTTSDFGLHGCLPGIKIPYMYICIEAATVAP